MELTKLINDVLSVFTSYIVDNAADPYYLDGVRNRLQSLNENINVDDIVTHMEILAGDIAAMSAETKDYLNVYTSNPTESWSGGVALIAANNADEANELLEELRDEGWRGYDYPRLVSKLRYIGESEIVFDVTYRE